MVHFFIQGYGSPQIAPGGPLFQSPAPYRARTAGPYPRPPLHLSDLLRIIESRNCDFTHLFLGRCLMPVYDTLSYRHVDEQNGHKHEKMCWQRYWQKWPRNGQKQGGPAFRAPFPDPPPPHQGRAQTALPPLGEICGLAMGIEDFFLLGLDHSQRQPRHRNSNQSPVSS